MLRQEPIEQMSGSQFVKLVNSEIERRNQSIGKLTAAEICKAAGVSDGYLRMLRRQQNPNPSVEKMRLILFVLGFQITKPDEDVIPYLQKKGVYRPESYTGALS